MELRQNWLKRNKISIECLMACLYFACIPLNIVETPFGSALKVVTFPIIAVLGVRLLMGKTRIVFSYIHFAYGLYILFTFIQLIYWKTDLAWITTRDMIFAFCMLVLISINVYNEKEKELIETAWLLAGIFCIYVALTSNETMSRSEGRAVIKIFGFEEDQNQFCSYFIFPILVSIKRIMKKSKIFPVYIGIVVLTLYSILKTGSRGGLLGIIAGIFAYVMIGIKSVKAKVAIVLSGIMVALLVVTVIVPMLPEDVQQRYSIDSVKEDKGSGRLVIWTYLLEYTFAKPERVIFGSGIMSTVEIMANAKTVKLQNSGAHNNFIQIFNDQGIVGLIMFLITVLLCFTRSYKMEPMYACALLSILVFTVSLAFYVFKPYINILMMCAMSFEGKLPEDELKRRLNC